MHTEHTLPSCGKGFSILCTLRSTVSKTLIFLFAFLLCAAASASAGVHDGSQTTFESRLIEHSLTPAKIEALEHRIRQSKGIDQTAIDSLNRTKGKTVFWRGVVQKFNRHPGYFWILLRTDDNRDVWVFAKSTIRNLDFDRTGFTVGVKGNPVIDKNAMACLKARSVVLIAPPERLSYPDFVRTYNLSTKFTLKTPQGLVEINHVHYPFILHRIYMHNPHYSWKTIQAVAGSIIYFSYKYPMDPLLVTALINVESAFDLDAVSSSGAVGLGQLMPSTAAGMGVNPKDPFQNVGGCTRYLHRNLCRWGNSRDQIPLALACYNAGPGAVDRYGGIPPYSETRNYVFFITMLHREYKKQFSAETGKPVSLAVPESPDPVATDELCVDR